MGEVRRPGPPPPPERRNSPPDSKEFREKMRKVEKVEKPGEVDPEEKQERRKFAKDVEEESQQEDERLTPLDAIFGRRKPETDIFGRNVPEDDEKVQQNYGNPTKSNISSPPFTREKDSDELPTSHQFWGQKTSEGKPQQQAEAEDGKKKGDEVVLPEQKKGKTEGSSPSKPMTEEEASTKALSQKEKEELAALAGKKGEVKEIAGAPEKEEKPKIDQKEREKIAKKEVDEKTTVSSIHEKRKREEKAKEKYGNLEGLAKSFSPITLFADSKEDGKTIPIASTPQPIAPEVISQAVGATTRAAPYLSPGVQDLFTQMVSTIIVMQSQGVTTTQVTLSSAAFLNTAFQGATITFQRYATAPDSYNIILSGSNQAVSLFNQNLPALERAFKQSNLPFRIGRLEAEYGEERHLIRRKKGAREKEDQ